MNAALDHVIIEYKKQLADIEEQLRQMEKDEFSTHEKTLANPRLTNTTPHSIEYCKLKISELKSLIAKYS